MNPITPWFEDYDFLVNLIKFGMQGLANNSNNTKGCVLYITDERFEDDAKILSEIIKKHNSKCK